MRTLVLAALGAALIASNGSAATPSPDIHVLSAAAVGSGLKAVADLYTRRSGVKVDIEFATGPEILARVSGGETADVLIAPDAVLNTLAGAHRLGAPPFLLGRVGVGVAIRQGARRPDISSVEAFKASTLTTDTVIYSRGSSGTYVEAMMQRLGLAEPTAGRTVRVANGGAVVTRLEQGSRDEIGISALTELAQGRDKGVVVVGPLPAAIQNFTAYSAAPGPAARPEAAAFVALLQTGEAKALMKINGVD